MKKEPVYPVDEVIKIMREAAELSMTTVDIPGFKGTFAIRPQNPTAASPKASEGPPRDTLGDFVTTFGKYKGWPLSRIPRKDLKDYGEYLLRDMDRADLSERVREWLDRADQYLRRA